MKRRRVRVRRRARKLQRALRKHARNLPKLISALLSLKIERVQQKLLQKRKAVSTQTIYSALLKTIQTVTREIRVRRRALNALLRKRSTRPRGTHYRVHLLQRPFESALQKKERAL
jgi:hypothetical protein